MGRVGRAGGLLVLAAAIAVTLGAGCHDRILPYGVVDPAAVEKVLAEVVRLRRITPKRPVRVRVISAGALRREVEADLARDVASGAIERQRKAWARIGLIDTDTDLGRAYADQFSEAPGGYYEHGALKLVEREQVRSEIAEIVAAVRRRDPLYGEGIAHELAHALQDQMLDLDGFASGAPDEDARVARRSLVEGDASKIGYMYGALFGSDFRRYLDWVEKRLPSINEDDQAPLYMRESFQFPYVYGARFAETLHREGGWPRVDAAYREPPASTEHILHPEKYLKRVDPPVAIAHSECAQALGSSWKRIWSVPLGELGVWLWLVRMNGGDAKVARKTAEGWGGDRAEVYEEGGETALLWRSVWDSEAEAKEMEVALARVPTSTTGARLVERRGARVHMVTGAVDQAALLGCGWR